MWKPCLIAILIATALAAQRAVFLKPPFGRENALFSPDRSRALFGSATSSELWIEDTATHQSRMVLAVTRQTLTLAWSPDSRAFAANDRAVSDVENAYIYDAKTLERLELNSLTLAADPEAVRLKNAGTHAYFHVLRWIDAGHVELQLFGHTDGARVGTSIRGGDDFDLRYRVARDGAIQRLSRRVTPLPN